MESQELRKLLQALEDKTLTKQWATKPVIIACLICMLLGAFVGGYVQSHWGARQIDKVHTKEIITLPPTVVKGDLQTIHTVEYVQKEVDPKTGVKEKTDVQIIAPTPILNVMHNDKPFAFTPAFQEGWIFENGKLVYKQQTKLDISITTPPPVRMPPDNISVGGYLGKHSGGATIDVGKFGVSLGPEWKNPNEIDYQVRWNFFRR